MSTDAAWEEWSRKDPYFGVITDPRFRAANLTQEAKAEFFDSGRMHADYVMQMIRLYIDPNFQPQSVLDFGCGVGRLVVPFAGLARQVTGLDVSPGMLKEARANCDERGLRNVSLLLSDDNLSVLDCDFDLIHSFIVFQHIPPLRGRELFRRLLRHLRPGGIGAFHFSYSKQQFAGNHGIAPAAPTTAAPSPRNLNEDPEMQMNPYHLNEVMFLIQNTGSHRLHAEFTDHGGELGLFIFFKTSS